MESKKGFTLAEVLITLTIIGIVAALTIPTLINNINEAQYTAGCKDMYNKLSQAISIIQSNNQGIIHAGSSTSNANDLKNDFCNVMACSKTYDDPDGVTLIDSHFGPHPVNALYKNPSDTTSVDSYLSNFYIYSASGAVLNNGSYLAFFDYNDCTSMYGYIDVNICGDIVVDINGNNGPNMSGEDLYFFHIAQDNNGVYSILPWGIPDDIASAGNGWVSPDCTVGSYGTTCTYQRLYNSNNMP